MINKIKKTDIVRLRDGTICEVVSINGRHCEVRPTDEHPWMTRSGYVIESGIGHGDCDIVEIIRKTDKLKVDVSISDPVGFSGKVSALYKEVTDQIHSECLKHRGKISFKEKFVVFEPVSKIDGIKHEYLLGFVINKDQQLEIVMDTGIYDIKNQPLSIYTLAQVLDDIQKNHNFD